MVKSLFGLHDKHNIRTSLTRYCEGYLTIAYFLNTSLTIHYGSFFSVVTTTGEIYRHAGWRFGITRSVLRR